MYIRDYYGHPVLVSEDMYVVTAPGDMGLGYEVGTIVRLVAMNGRGHEDEPGWHDNPDFVTVTDVSARNAQFVGCRKVALRPLLEKVEKILDLPKLLSIAIEPCPTAAIIVVRKGKALILQRGMTAPWMPGAWNLPGGMMDEGETPLDAAKRECIEETGINPSDIKFHRKIVDPGFTLYIFTGETNQAKPRLDHENDGFAWVTSSDLKHYQFVPYVADEINKVLAR